MGGFANSISNNIDVVFAKNGDFSGAANPNDTNGLQTNGQLWIGSTALNAGSTHINVGNISSPLGTLTIGYSSPNITIDLNGGKVAVETLSDDIGTVTTPTANNIQLVGHIVEQGASKFSTTIAGTHLININPMSCARWIVDPLGFNGTHTTITSALTSATSGDTIFILPGTYTENLTLKAGVGLSAFTSDSRTPNVKIVGKLTATFAGTCALSGIQLQTNSDFLLAVTGSSATIVKLVNCQLIASNNTAISFTSSDAGSQIVLSYCFGDITTTGIAFFSMSSAGNLTIFASRITNSGASTTASTASAGSFTFQFNSFNFPITTSSTHTFGSFSCTYNNATLNTTALTIGGSGANNSSNDYYASGTASAISIGSSLTLHTAVVNSTNTNAITGAGSVTYAGITFQGSSVKINTTTQIGGLLQGGVAQAPSAGFIGERLETTVATGSPVNLSTNTPATVATLSLTAGVWDVSTMCVINGTLQTRNQSGPSLVNNTLGASGVGIETFDTPTSATAAAGVTMVVPAFRFTLTTTTNVFMVANSIFTGSAAASGRISATRVG